MRRETSLNHTLRNGSRSVVLKRFKRGDWHLPLLGLLVAVLWLGGTYNLAWAHKVTIFAWVEGDTVYTQSKFSGGKKAKNSTVTVLDLDGNQLLTGKTDENGEFSFKAPQKTDLKIVLSASMGHLGEWVLSKEEFAGGDGPSGVVDEQPAVDAHGHSGAKENESATGPPAIGLSRAEVRQVVEEVVSKKLAPITHMLIASQEKGPTMEKVICGIGYILGLVGVAFYFSGRGKKR